MKYGHLEQLKVACRMLSPVFIGSGGSLTKKEYIFDPEKALIYLPDLFKLVAFLKERRLLPSYEQYLTQTRSNDLCLFLRQHQIAEKDYTAFVRYSIEAGEAARAANFREVLTFVKGPDGKPYIPGSSIKGAIRTALAARLLKKGNWGSLQNSVESEANNYRGPRHYLDRECKSIEERIFDRLGISDTKHPNNRIPAPINDFMRGIQVGDSSPLEYSSLILAGKYERKPDGSVKVLPIFRECLRPGSTAHFALTLDLPVLAKTGIDQKYIEDALHAFSDEHYAAFEEHFPESSEDAPIAADEGVDLILGGGAGYVSKTLTYNLFADRRSALSLTAKILDKQFARHKHAMDPGVYKVSPHILKTVLYKNCYYQMGRCELIFN